MTQGFTVPIWSLSLLPRLNKQETVERGRLIMTGGFLVAARSVGLLQSWTAKCLEANSALPAVQVHHPT